MNRILLIIFSFCTICSCNYGNSDKIEEKFINSKLLILSEEFDPANANQLIQERIKNGIYEEYEVDLCVDDTSRCNSPEIVEYKKTHGNSLIVHAAEWVSYPEFIKREIINEILYYTWGGKPEYLKGGKGDFAYGPNCWSTALSAILDNTAPYSKLNNIKFTLGDLPRFMGPAEFRQMMNNFDKVDSPEFGDILRYYSDSAYYDESIYLFNGEVHAAVYMGRDTGNKVNEIVLTKNGRSDLSFLLFQDVKNLDKTYLTSSGKIKKAYFRVKKGSIIKDPALCHTCSESYQGYKTDSINYSERLDCLANKIKPDTCNKKNLCFCYPKQWIVN